MVWIRIRIQTTWIRIRIQVERGGFGFGFMAKGVDSDSDSRCPDSHITGKHKGSPLSVQKGVKEVGTLWSAKEAQMKPILSVMLLLRCLSTWVSYCWVHEYPYFQCSMFKWLRSYTKPCFFIFSTITIFYVQPTIFEIVLRSHGFCRQFRYNA